MKAKTQQEMLQDLAAEKKQQKLDAVTRKVAIAFVFIGVFYFLIKLLFL
jgi:hypothetical protein